MGLLEGKVAVITGGSRGLGLGIARAYAQAGAAVVVASRSQTSVDEAVRQINAEGGRASGMAVDVARLDQMEALAEEAVRQYGRLDVWLNNAGIATPYGATLGYPPDDFYKVVQTNILGVYHGSRAAMRIFTARGKGASGMNASGPGKLINVLGHGDKRPVPWQNAYASSKAWVRSFTKALAEETKDSGVGVFAFNPGMVLTELLTEVDVVEGAEERLKVFPTILRMWAKPVEVPANKAVWIASPATDGKTGLVISMLSPWMMLEGALKEGLRVLLKKPAPDMGIRVRTIPYYTNRDG